MPEKASRKTLSRQAARKCAGKGVSRHRGLPRATLSTITPLQSLREDILRQHFAKFHYVHPDRPTPSSQTGSSWMSHTVIKNSAPVIPNAPPHHPERPSVVYDGLGLIPRLLSFPPLFIIFSSNLIYLLSAKLLQKSEMRKDIVIELSYKGFGWSGDNPWSHYNPGSLTLSWIKNIRK